MLIVGTNANYAATGGVANSALSPADLDKGSVGIYGVQKGEFREKLIISGSTTTGKIGDGDFKGDTFKICEGLGGGKFKTSEYIYTKGVKAVNPSAYRAPVAWKGYIGNNGTTGAIVINGFKTGQLQATATIEIKELASNRETGQPLYFDIIVVPADTATTILAKIKAAVDAGYGGAVDFTTVINGGNTGIALTSVDLLKQYQISINGHIELSSVSYVGGDKGSGTYERLAPVEALSQAKRGNFYTQDMEFSKGKSVPASLVEGGTYDIYVIDAINAKVAGGYGGAGLAGNADVQTSIEVIAAFAPDGDTAGGNQIEFETIIATITGIAITSLVEDDTP